METIQKNDTYLKIGHEKICNCPVNHINCLTALMHLRLLISYLFTFTIDFKTSKFSLVN
jgi:hypothetical protein